MGRRHVDLHIHAPRAGNPALKPTDGGERLYRSEEAPARAFLPPEDVAEVGHRGTFFRRQLRAQLHAHERVQGFNQEPLRHDTLGQKPLERGGILSCDLGPHQADSGEEGLLYQGVFPGSSRDKYLLAPPGDVGGPSDDLGRGFVKRLAQLPTSLRIPGLRPVAQGSELFETFAALLGQLRRDANGVSSSIVPRVYGNRRLAGEPG